MLPDSMGGHLGGVSFSKTSLLRFSLPSTSTLTTLRMEDAADHSASVTFAADTKEEEDVEEGSDEKKGFLEKDKGEGKGTDDKEGGGEKRKVTYSEALVRSKMIIF